MSDHVVGLGDIARYFSTPTNHADDDHAHVSRDELAAAKGRISPAADSIIDAVVSDRSNYRLMSELQTEG